MSATNETRRLRSIRAGDVNVFKDLFEEKFAGLVNLAFQYVSDKDIAKDVVQQVFIRFWEKKESLFIQSSISGYLRQMVINESLAYIRTEKRRKELARPIQNAPKTLTNNTDQSLLNGELKSQISQAIETLPEKCRVIFKMSRYESMTYQEIANELNISMKTVENQIGTALKKLRYSLKRYLHSIFL